MQEETPKKQDELELYQIDEASIVPFFKEHLADLQKFIQEHKNQGLSLLELLKQFIRTHRLPFTMQRYMMVQSTFIKQSIHDKVSDRQAAVSHWIQEHAGRHRDRMIQLQCLYLDRIKEKMLPELKNILEKALESSSEDKEK